MSTEDVLSAEIGITLDRLARNLADVEARMVRTAKKMEADWGGANKRIFDGMGRKANEAMTAVQASVNRITGVKAQFSSAADSADAFGEALDQADKVNRLKASLDPLFAATQRYEAAVLEVNRAVELGAISQREANAVLALAERQYQTTAAALSRMDAGVAQAATGIRRFGPQIQGAGYQLGDFAVQVGSGTSALQAAGQQAPQFLGAFGPIGAVLGLIAAVALPVAGAILATGDASEESAAKVRTFEQALSDAQGALARADAALATVSAGGAEDLDRIYGSVTARVRELARALADIEVRAATQEVAASLDELFGEDFGASIQEAVGGLSGALAAASTDEVRAQVAELEAEIANIDSTITLLDPSGREAQLARETIAGIREEIATLQGDVANAGSLADALTVSPEAIERIRELRAAIPEALAAGVEDSGQAEAISAMIAEMRGLMEGLGIEVREGFGAELAQAQSLIEQTAGTLRTAEEAMGGLTAETRGAGIAAEVTASETARLRAETELAESAAVRLASAASGINFGGAISSAQALAGTLAGALNIAERLANRAVTSLRTTAEYRLAMVPGAELRARDDGRGSQAEERRAGARVQTERILAAQADLPFRQVASGGGGGGRGGGGGGAAARPEPSIFETTDKQIARLNQQMEAIGQTDGEVARLTARYGLLEAARERNLDLNAREAGSEETIGQRIDRQAEAVGRLTEQYDQARERAQFFEGVQDNLKDGFLDAIVAGEGFEGALEGVAKALARAALEAALFGSGPFATGGGGVAGLLGGFLRLPSFAGGGSTGMGPRLGGLDGRGGFLAINHPNETVVDHTRGQSASRGGAVRVIGGDLTLTDDGRIMSRVRVEVAQGGARTVARVGDAMGRSKAFGARR